MHKLILVSLALVTLTTLSKATPLKYDGQNCDPGNNCKLPDCRCWNDPKKPGDFDRDSTPQMILITFTHAFNNHTVKRYFKLMNDLKNPNNCHAKGTFFAQKYNSDPSTIRNLFDLGHEIGISSIDGVRPTDLMDWIHTLTSVWDFLHRKAHVGFRNVVGVRTPNNWFGGDVQFEAMSKLAVRFDSTCVTTYKGDSLWPFTTDFGHNMTKCGHGDKLTKDFKGVWEFPVNALRFHNEVCPQPSGCIGISSSDEVFRMFISNFNVHYYGNRAPFVLDIDPQWLIDDDKFLGTKQFLELIEAYPDTWFITMSQALQWIKNPVAMSPAVSFEPWNC